MTTTVDIARPRVPPDRPAVPARLEFRRGGSSVTITTAQDLGRLCRASFVGPAPRLREQDRTITIKYPLVAPAGWLRASRRAAAVTLAAEEPWEIVFTGGIADLRADLSDSELRSLDIASGVSDGRLRLPEPHGIVHLRIGGGTHNLEILRPAGTATRRTGAPAASRQLTTGSRPSLGCSRTAAYALPPTPAVIRSPRSSTTSALTAPGGRSPPTVPGRARRARGLLCDVRRPCREPHLAAAHAVRRRTRDAPGACRRARRSIRYRAGLTATGARR